MYLANTKKSKTPNAAERRKGMKSVRASEERFVEVLVRSTKAMFSEMRIDRSSIPKGLHVYEVRHADEDWSEPCEVKRGIMVNFYGTLITKEPLLEEGESSLYLEGEKEWEFLSSGSVLGLDEWNRKN